MTPEIDLLNVTSSKDVKTNTNIKEEKQAPSLFDSLLKDAKSSVVEEKPAEVKNEKSIKKNDSKSKSSDESESKIKESQDSDTSESSNSKKVSSKEEESPKDAKEKREQYEPSSKKESSSSNSNGSLLDRLVLEAKTTVKKDTKIETKVSDSNTENSKDIKKVSNSKVEDKNIETKDKSKELTKTPIEKSENIDKKLANSIDNKKHSENLELVKETKKTDTQESKTLDTKNIKEEKLSSLKSSNENIEKADLNKEKTISLKTDEMKEKNSENKITDLDTNDKKIEKKELKNLEVEDKDLKNLDDEKTQKTSLENKKESQTDIKNSELNTKDINVDTKVEVKTNSDEIKIESKEQKVQTNLVENTKKDEIKSKENSILDKEVNTKKIETLNIEDNKLEKNEENIKSSENKLSSTSTDTIKNSSSTVAINSETKNEKVASQLASIQKTESVDTDIPKVNLSKEEIINAPKQKEEKSLMDRLVDESKKTINDDKLEKSSLTDKSTTTSSSKDILTSIYLSSQKSTMDNQSIKTKAEAMNLAKDANSIKDVEKSGNMLDLNVEKLDVKVEESLKSEVKENIDKKSFLDRVAFNNNIRRDEINHNINKINQVTLQNETPVKEESQTTVNLNVNPSLAHNIQTRIIGAQQQMSSMMSDVARQMYENYKPPVTAFRINLNPSQLGTIAILMKNDKDNGITISLNISNNATLDSFVENQNSLRNSLSKTFDEGTTFNLDFGSQNENSSSSSEQKDNNSSSSENRGNTQAILESRDSESEKDRNIDYM